LPSPKKNKPFSSAEQRKNFRHGIAVLKKKGLVSKDVDARKAVPTRTLNKKLKEFSDVVSGQARVWKLPKALAPAYKEQGYRVNRGKVILQPSQYIPSRGRDKGFIKTSEQTGKGPRITSVHLPFRLKHLNRDLAMLRQRVNDGAIRLDDGEYYGFEFFGWHSTRLFENFDQLVDHLMMYETFEAGSEDQIAERVRNVVIMKVDNDEAQDWYGFNIARVKKTRRRNSKVRKAKKTDKPISGFARENRKEYNRLYAQLNYDKAANTEKKRRQRANKAKKGTKK
jgi:hypothetical protein